jgi:hypothetical protein
MSCPSLYPSILINNINYPLAPEDYAVTDKPTSTIKVRRGSLEQEVPIGQKILTLELKGKVKSEIASLQAKAKEDIVKFYSGIEGDIQANVDGNTFTNALLYKVTARGEYIYSNDSYYEEVSLTIVSLRLTYLI